MSLIGSVFERRPTGKGTTSPSKAPVGSASTSRTGFPLVQHRSKSAFVRGREEAKRRPDNETAKHRKVPDVHSAHETQASKTVPVDWREQVSRENEARVESMTEEERQQQVREIIGRFGSGIGDVLKKARASRADNRKLRFAELTPGDVHVYESAPPSPRKTAPLLLLPPPDHSDGSDDKPISLGTWGGTVPASFAAPLGASEPPSILASELISPSISSSIHQQEALASKTDSEPDVGSPEYIRRRYFPHIPANDPSLAWIEEASAPTSSSSSLRFDLTGTPIPSSRSSSLPTHLGLHHHAEGSRAGYTLDDIFLLTRSTVPAQRTVMLGVLAGIVRWLSKNVARLNGDKPAYDGVDGVDEVKGKEDELRKRILAAGVNAMGERGSPGARAVEVIWECIVGWEGDLVVDSRVVSTVEMEERTRVPEKTKSAISTLPLEFILPQISESFALGALSQDYLAQLLGVVHRLARENVTIAEAIVATPKLLPNLVHNFLPALPSTTDPISGANIEPNPLALETLIILASASRSNAKAIVEFADTLLRFITTLPSSSPFGEPLATTLLSLTLRLYTTLASYGLYASIATTATAQFAAIHRYTLGSNSSRIRVDYLHLLHAWIVCAIDPHRTTPKHEILWSQIVGWGWATDILGYRGSIDSDSLAEWAAIWNAEAAWLEGCKVNSVRGGSAEREVALAAMKDGFESGKEHSAVSSALDLTKQQLEACTEPAHLASLSDPTAASAAALRLWIACAPPATATLEAPHLSLPFDSLSELCAQVVNHRLWLWLKDDAIVYRNPYLIALCRPITQFLYAFLRVSRCLPGVPDDLWLAQAFTILKRLVPGDEDNAVSIMGEIASQVNPGFASSNGIHAPQIIWDRGGLSILQPFYGHMLRPDKGKYIGPLRSTPQSIAGSTTQRMPSASSVLFRKSESTGLPLDRDWSMSVLTDLLHSGTSPVFQDLPTSWDASETEVVRASLFLAKVQKGVLETYRLRDSIMSGAETVFTCMRVFMLEHGQPHNDSSDEVFRDAIVSQFMSDLLTPHTVSMPSSATSSTATQEKDDLEKVAVRILGPSTPFYQYYTDFVALYDAISFSHPIFTRLLLPPTSMRYPPDYRKYLWNDYAHLLKNIRTPISDIVGSSLDEYLHPVETDAMLLGAYLRPLVRGQLEQSEFLRKFAVHHIASNIWGDLAEDVSMIDSSKAIQLLKVVVQGGNAVTRDVVLYDTTIGGVTCQISPEKRRGRLGRLEKWSDKELESLRGLLEA